SFCSHDRHVSRRHHRITAAGGVAAGAAHRYVAMAQPHARHRFHFDILERRSLMLREISNLRLRESDVLNRFARDRRHQRVDLSPRQPEIRGGPAIEALGKFPHGRIAALPHIRDDFCNRLLYLDSCSVGLGRWETLLQVLRHSYLPDVDRLDWSESGICNVTRSSVPTTRVI